MTKHILYKLDSTGRITSALDVIYAPEDAYRGYEKGDVPEGSTHCRNGVFLTQPAAPSSAHVWDDAAFAWVYDVDRAWAAVRARRAELLLACDWTQLPDVPAGTQLAWWDYRQALRDITTQPDPTQITWPAAPGSTSGA